MVASGRAPRCQSFFTGVGEPRRVVGVQPAPPLGARCPGSPVSELFSEVATSDLVKVAYGLTPAEVHLMWDTAPPRMPIPRPTLLSEDEHRPPSSFKRTTRAAETRGRSSGRGLRSADSARSSGSSR